MLKLEAHLTLTNFWEYPIQPLQRRLKRQIGTLHEDEPIESLFYISDQLSEQKTLEDAIKICIDDNAEVADSASVTLAQIRR